jgi:DNA-binding MurR/RpiR family transcriptional regulator
MIHLLTSDETNETQNKKTGGIHRLGESFDVRLASAYSTLSAKLRQAADFVVENPVDTATRSLRSVAGKSGVAPATFTRLAQALKYDSFEALRDVIRASINRKVDSFSTRVDRLHSQHGTEGSDFTTAHMEACLDNIRKLGSEIDRAQLDQTVEQLSKARKVMLLGSLGSSGIAEYMSYMASFLTDNWALAGRGGASLGSIIGAMDERDALIVITKPPFAQRVLNAAKLASERGVYVIVITDSYACDALRYAASSFIIPTNTPHFYSSYTSTIFLVETIVGKLAACAEASAGERIALIEQHNRRLQETSNGTNLN